MVPTKLIPSAGGLEGQVSVLQSSMAGMFAQNAFVAAGNTREAEDDGAVITDIEYGLVKEVPDSTPSATIVLRPCDANGTEYASADDVTVYVRADRAAVDQSLLDWTTSTVLSWFRFSSDIGSSPAISGVLFNLSPNRFAPTDETEVRTYTYKAHLALFCELDDLPFWTIPDCLNADLIIMPEIRACEEGSHPGGCPNCDPGEHPTKKGLYSYANIQYGMQDWKVEEEGSDDWTDITVYVVLTNGSIVGLYGVSGTFSTTVKMQVRVNTSGALQFRFLGSGETPSLPSCVLYISVMVIPRINGLDVPELGSGEALDINGDPYCDHEILGTPENCSWNPVTEPVPFIWGDGLWRSV